MNSQVQSLVTGFLVEGGNAKEIKNFALVSKSAYSPHTQYALKKLEVKHLRQRARFWKTKAYSLALGTQQLLSYEPLIIEMYRYCYDEMFYDDSSFENRLHEKTNVQLRTLDVLKSKALTERY